MTRFFFAVIRIPTMNGRTNFAGKNYSLRVPQGQLKIAYQFIGGNLWKFGIVNAECGMGEIFLLALLG